MTLNKNCSNLLIIPASTNKNMINSMMKFYKNSNILEHNLVQTSASAGESLAAGVIFTIPALILLGYWESFNYIEVAKIAAIGGLIGVLSVSYTHLTLPTKA